MEKQNKSVWHHILCLAVLILTIGIGFTGCKVESRGFVLPEGDVEIGRATFVEMGCNHCHSVGDIFWMGSEELDDPLVPLGGVVSSLKTYGELVTSVINPSHKISQKYLKDQQLTDSLGQSRMEVYSFNEIMTIQQLVDIVTFLQTEYDLVKPVNPVTQ